MLKLYTAFALLVGSLTTLCVLAVMAKPAMAGEATWRVLIDYEFTDGVQPGADVVGLRTYMDGVELEGCTDSAADEDGFSGSFLCEFSAEYGSAGSFSLAKVDRWDQVSLAGSSFELNLIAIPTDFQASVDRLDESLWRTSFAYSFPDGPVDAFRIYKGDEIFCETSDPLARALVCDKPIELGEEVTFSLVALVGNLESSGVEVGAVYLPNPPKAAPGIRGVRLEFIGMN